MNGTSPRLPRVINTQLRHHSLFTASNIRPRIWTHSIMTDALTPKRRLNNPAIFVCDLQEKFRNAIHEFDKVVLTTQKVLRAAQALNIPIYATTQNRARLGDTVEDLQQHLSGPLCRVTADKTRFSMWIPEVVSQLPSGGAETGGNPADIVLVGIESHICITQTALDALAAGHRVYVLADGVSSCNREEVPLALARLRAEGATVTTSESWLYEVVGDAGLPEFKSVIAIVKDTLQDTKKVLAALAPAQGGSRI